MSNVPAPLPKGSALTTIADVAQDPTAAEHAAILREMTDGDTYSVGRKKRLSAAGVNKAFVNLAVGENAAAVGVRIIDAGKDEEKAWAHVAAYRGQKAAPIIEMEDKVTMIFSDLKEQILWDWVAREGKKNHEIGIFLGPDGRPCPVSEKDQISLARLFFNKRYFSDRDCVTHAQERAQRKVLAQEWRNKGERNHEVDEIMQVRNERKREARDRPPFTIDTPMPYGKHQGRTLRSMLGDPQDRSWMGWACSENGLNRSPDIQASCREALGMWQDQKNRQQHRAQQTRPQRTAAQSQGNREAPLSTSPPPVAARPGPASPTPSEPAPAPSAPPHNSRAYCDAIVSILRGWPDVLDTKQVASYEESLAQATKLERTIPLHQHSPELLQRLHSHVESIDNLRKAVVVRIEDVRGDSGEANLFAIDWLNKWARNFERTGIFDPTLHKKNVVAITAVLAQLTDDEIKAFKVDF